MQESSKVLTAPELADFLKISRATVYRLLKLGQLPGFRIGYGWRFDTEAIYRLRMGEWQPSGRSPHQRDGYVRSKHHRPLLSPRTRQGLSK